jgi:hypothetical protein
MGEGVSAERAGRTVEMMAALVRVERVGLPRSMSTGDVAWIELRDFAVLVQSCCNAESA